MTKRNLAQNIAHELGIPLFLATAAIQKTLDGITETLVQEGRIELRNFGVFEVKQRKARKARNPRTNEPVQMPSRKVVRFKPGLVMAQRVDKLVSVPS